LYEASALAPPAHGPSGVRGTTRAAGTPPHCRSASRAASARRESRTGWRAFCRTSVRLWAAGCAQARGALEAYRGTLLQLTHARCADRRLVHSALRLAAAGAARRVLRFMAAPSRRCAAGASQAAAGSPWQRCHARYGAHARRARALSRSSAADGAAVLLFSCRTVSLAAAAARWARWGRATPPSKRSSSGFRTGCVPLAACARLVCAGLTDSGRRARRCCTTATRTTSA
jgi:hypothetical protein